MPGRVPVPSENLHGKEVVEAVWSINRNPGMGLTIPGVTCHLETLTRASDDLPAEAGRVRILSYFMPEPAPGRRRLLMVRAHSL
jgi:hypothetical protein